jgi:hypothetical protein
MQHEGEWLQVVGLPGEAGSDHDLILGGGLRVGAWS